MGMDPSVYRGCLLGLAAGDALGCAVDKKTLDEIREDYGPQGLMGYDLVNGHAEISSYTQLAAFACNGLLVGLARGQSAPSMRCVVQALLEWAHAQHFPRDNGRTCCWLCKVPQLRRHRSMDPRTLDALTRNVLSTPEAPKNQANSPGILTAAIAAGLYFDPERMDFADIGRVGMQIVALTHGDPAAFLCGSFLAYAIAGILQEPSCPLKTQFTQAAAAVRAQFGQQYPQAAALQRQIRMAIALAERPDNDHPADMEALRCVSCAETLAGAVYAVLASGNDFDTAMIIAANHSGKSAAVAAIAGAVLGAALGEEALPEFYLESLSCAPVLRELAEDLCASSPRDMVGRLFDDVWDRKYIQGEPVEKEGWAEE